MHWKKPLFLPDPSTRFTSAWWTPCATWSSTHSTGCGLAMACSCYSWSPWWSWRATCRTCTRGASGWDRTTGLPPGSGSRGTRGTGVQVTKLMSSDVKFWVILKVAFLCTYWSRGTVFTKHYFQVTKRQFLNFRSSAGKNSFYRFQMKKKPKRIRPSKILRYRQQDTLNERPSLPNFPMLSSKWCEGQPDIDESGTPFLEHTPTRFSKRAH